MCSKLDIFTERLKANLALDDDRVLDGGGGAYVGHYDVLLLFLDHRLHLDDGRCGGGSRRQNRR